MKFTRLKTFFGLASLALIGGCGGGSGGPSSPAPPQPQVPPSGGLNAPVSLNLVPFADPWTAARQRFWDIDDRPLDDFIRDGFQYNSAQVTLTYDAAPDASYFVGRIRARGLKPNFCYQMKLAGKPRDGARGWDAFSDDASNARIGAIGRYWDDTTQNNETDAGFAQLYQNAAPANRHTIYGYQLMNDFVTDENGNADLSFDGSQTFHVSWQDKQNQHQDYALGTFAIGTRAPFYGYGHAAPGENIKLWLERQSDRPARARLASGNYNCRFILTEEAFHNLFGGTNDSNGGLWLTVLANEDFRGGAPDSNTSNDIRFTIK